RRFSQEAHGMSAATHPPACTLVRQAAGALVSFDHLPRPQEPVGAWILPVLLSTAVLVLAAAWLVRRTGASASPREHAAAYRFGAVWAVLGTFPILLPTVGWHAYYGCLG